MRNESSLKNFERFQDFLVDQINRKHGSRKKQHTGKKKLRERTPGAGGKPHIHEVIIVILGSDSESMDVGFQFSEETSWQRAEDQAEKYPQTSWTRNPKTRATVASAIGSLQWMEIPGKIFPSESDLFIKLFPLKDPEILSVLLETSADCLVNGRGSRNTSSWLLPSPLTELKTQNDVHPDR